MPSPVRPKLFLTRTLLGFTVFLCLAILVSCGGSSKMTTGTSVPPNISGAWEFVALATTGSVTGVEVAMQEGQTLVNGLEQPDGQISASNTQIAFVSLTNATQNLNATGFGGDCMPVTSANSLGPGSITGASAPMTFSFTENGNVYNVTGTLAGDGQSMINGTYTLVGNGCPDIGGTITGKVVSKLSGSFTGQMCPLASTSTCQTATDNVTSATLSQSGSTAKLTLVLTGTDNTSITLSGLATGNAFFVQGTFQGQTLSFSGYSEQIFDNNLQTNVPSLYLANANNPDATFFVGTLSTPQ